VCLLQYRGWEIEKRKQKRIAEIAKKRKEEEKSFTRARVDCLYIMRF
jgi:hypothetical protein